MSPEPTPATDPGVASPDAIPATLRPVLTDPDKPILLLVAPDASESSAGAAVRMAEARAAEGRDTVLADGAVEDPVLHQVVGVPNLEGLADVFLFGASLARVRTRPEGYAFDFVPTGAYVPDPAAVLDSSGWDRLATELGGAGTLLMLFVPAATSGLGALSRRIGRAVIIAGDEGVDRVQERLDPRCDVLGVVDPSGADTRAAPTEPAPVEAEVGADPAGTSLSEPVVFRGEGGRRRLVSPLLLVLLVLALIVGGWFLYQEYLAGAAPTEAPNGEVSEELGGPVERGEPIETPIPVSVAVEAYAELDDARDRVDALRAAEPDLEFYLAPVSDDGMIYYRLLAGPVADQAAGDALLRRLVDAEHKTAMDAWAIRPTALAFDLGDYDSREAAQARSDSLAALDIPTYIVRIRHESGPDRYRVYGGAYENAAEAEAMTEMLETAGIEPRLVTRTGAPAA